MKPDIHPAEPAVRSPELQQLVALARAQPLPPARTDADRVHAGFLAARQARRTRLGVAAGLLLAAGLAALVLTRVDLGLSRTTGPSGHVAQDMSPKAPGDVAVPRGPALATGARARPGDDTSPAPTVLGPWEVALAPGRYQIEVDPHPGPELLRARSPGGDVELHHGRVEIVVASAATRAKLEEGSATWVAPDGQRSALTSDPTPGTLDESDVRALARRAEALITAGQRDPAIGVLTQIVTRHAHEPAARGALLDLAPLLKAAGRVDEARCAYRLYLGRYPGKAQLADEVRKALARLGPGPACDDLTPR